MEIKIIEREGIAEAIEEVTPHFFSRLFLALSCLLAVRVGSDTRAADPKTSPFACVRIPSHGCSGTVIETGPGRTLILSCAHAFQGQDAARPVKLDCPHSAAGQPKRATIRQSTLR